MSWHEIVKYSPQNYNSDGVYTADEWTSRCDVGKCYDGKSFTLEEYLNVEQHYIAVVISVMKATNCKYMTIQYLEADKEDIVSRIKSSKFYDIDSPLLNSISYCAIDLCPLSQCNPAKTYLSYLIKSIDYKLNLDMTIILRFLAYWIMKH